MADLIAVIQHNIYSDGTTSASVSFYKDGGHVGTTDIEAPPYDAMAEKFGEMAPPGHALAAPLAEPEAEEPEAASAAAAGGEGAPTDGEGAPTDGEGEPSVN